MFYSQDNQDKFLEQNIFKGYKNGFFFRCWSTRWCIYK